MKTHEHWDELLVFYVEGTLADDEKCAFEKHLEGCESCHAALADWREIADAVRFAAQKEAYTLPPLALLEAASQKPANKEIAGFTDAIPSFEMRRRGSSNTILQMILFAAAVSLLVFGGFNLYRFTRTEQAYIPIVSTQDIPPTVYELISTDSRFTLFTEAINRYPEIREMLMGTQAITVFVPTDNVMRSFLQQANSASISQISDYQLHEIIIEHLVKGDQTTDVLAASGYASGTLVYAGYRYNTVFRVEPDDDGHLLIIDRWLPRPTNVQIVEANIRASNGIIHIIDSVLLPQDFFLRVQSETSGGICLQLPCPTSPL